MALDRKTKARLALFLLALAVAVGSFTHGVLELGHRESGWYEIDATAEARAVTYSSGMRLMYYAAGSSSDIRQRLNAVQAAYSDCLLRYHKMLDATTEYEDAVNLASISAAKGRPVVIGEALYRVLSDALARTRAGNGYSLFGGALWREWETLLYLDEPAPFDPANNPEEAARLAALAQAIHEPGAFSLTLEEDGFTAAFSASPAYQALMERLEIDAPALDLGPLRDAYLLDLTAEAMTAQGLTDGYLFTDSGLIALLGGKEAYRLGLSSWRGGEAVNAGILSLTGPAMICQFTAFPPAGERYGWYAVDGEDGPLLRHPHFDMRTGGFHEVLLSVTLASETRSAADLAGAALALYAMDSVEAVERWMNEQREVAAVCALRKDGGRLRFNAPASGMTLLEN